MFLKKMWFYEICSKKLKVTNTGVYGLYICKNVSLFYKIKTKISYLFYFLNFDNRYYRNIQIVLVNIFCSYRCSLVFSVPTVAR
jgi:hypothetical protein